MESTSHTAKHGGSSSGHKEEFLMRNKFEFEEMVFDSNFEAGNLLHVEQIAPLNYALTITPDCYKTKYENHHAVWFYFRVNKFHFQDHHKKHTVAFHIKNMGTNQMKNIKEGMRPVYKTNKHPEWNYIPYPLENTVFHEKAIEYTFKFDFQKEDHEVFFAFAVPYTYTDLENFLDDFETKIKSDKSLYFHREILNYSLEGRKIELLTLTGHTGNEKSLQHDTLLPYLFPNAKTDISHDDTEKIITTSHPSRPLIFTEKKYVFISSRIHPAEAPGSWILHGLLKKFQAHNEDKITQELLKHYVFVIIPMINPDGVVRGYYRSDVKGRDLNRVYNKAKPKEHPGPYAVLEVSKQLTRNKNLFMFLDIHAHSNEEAAFVFGNYTTVLEEKAIIRSFAHLLDIYSKHFDLNSCSYGSKPNPDVKDPSKIGVGKTEVGKATNCPLCFTLEASYHKGTKEPERYSKHKPAKNDDEETESNIYTLNINDFQEVGENLRHALLELIGHHPDSKLHETHFGSMAGLRDKIEKELASKKPQAGGSTKKSKRKKSDESGDDGDGN